jgi:Carboxylesterase family
MSMSSLNTSHVSVTVMGESAGASSILHHITAKSGNVSLPFQKAILQSTAYLPQYSYFWFSNLDMILLLWIYNIIDLQRRLDVRLKEL